MTDDIYELAARDLMRFADPFTEASIKTSAKGYKIALTRFGRELGFEIDKSNGRVAPVNKKSVATFSSVNSLLASPEFADLPSLVRTQLRAYKAPKDMIPVAISLGGEGQISSISDRVAQKANGLELYLLDGPAGIGKTFQIGRAVHEQAEKAVRGAAIPPILHVSSQGRRLSNLSDVLARATQDLGARFSGGQVPILVKRGLLAIAIDGFDELVDADGYDDAWMALKAFMGDLDGSGKVILAARDTFVDEQELLTRIGENLDGLTLSKIHLRPSSADAAIEWLSKSPSWKAADLDAPITRDVLTEGSYTLRPFFLKELREAKGWKDVIESGPRTYLIHRYLKRESDLIAQQLGGVKGIEILPRLQSLFEEIALQMGERELDRIELEQLEFMTEFAFDGLLEPASIRKLAHKAGSFALLEISGVSQSRSFPHSEVRNYFLGMGIMRSLAAGSVPAVMRRGLLNAEHMQVFAEVMEAEPELARSGIVDVLLAKLASGDQVGTFSSNAGSLALLAASQGMVNRLDYIDAIDATFAGGVPELALAGSNVNRLDARDSDISRLQLSDSRIETLVVDDRTKLPAALDGVREVELHGSEQAVLLRGSEIAEWLSGKQAQGGQEFGSPAVLLMQRLARRVIRHHYLREKGGDDEATFMLQDSSWPLVKKILERHSRIEVISNKQMKGKNSLLFRILRPRDLLDESNAETVKILRDIRDAETG